MKDGKVKYFRTVSREPLSSKRKTHFVVFLVQNRYKGEQISVLLEQKRVCLLSDPMCPILLYDSVFCSPIMGCKFIVLPILLLHTTLVLFYMLSDQINRKFSKLRIRSMLNHISTGLKKLICFACLLHLLSNYLLSIISYQAWQTSYYLSSSFRLVQWLMRSPLVCGFNSW